MHDVAVIGAGLAGLTCARSLVRAGKSVVVLEANDAPGGRVRTDVVEGFLLDRGFQALLDAYPEARRELDYAALDLCRFAPGALVRRGGRFHRIVDPFRAPRGALGTVLAQVGSIADKLRIARFRSRVRASTLDALFHADETTAQQALREEGFSSTMVDAFFRSFYGGVFLERELSTSSRMLRFTFRMFSEGSATIPSRGMGAIGTQLAGRLPSGALRLGSRVERAEPKRGVTLATGETIEAEAIVVAADADGASALAGSPKRTWRGTTCLYFTTEHAPIDEPILVLDGEGQGPVNHLAVLSVVAPSYAPVGAHLVSANVVGEAASLDDDVLEASARAQLGEWFGPAVARWQLLRVVRVPHSLPRQDPPSAPSEARIERNGAGLWIAGDHVATASIQGAMLSGRLTAEAIVAAG